MLFASLENLDDPDGTDEINSYVDLYSKGNASEIEFDSKLSNLGNSISPDNANHPY